MELSKWLGRAIGKLAPGDPARKDLEKLKADYTVLQDKKNARDQVAGFYKQWFDVLGEAPETARSLLLFQDLSSAFVVGKSLPSLPRAERPGIRPERVAEYLMTNCLEQEEA